jgi:predicted lipoprotein with Yx(FWY)xxD motif
MNGLARITHCERCSRTPGATNSEGGPFFAGFDRRWNTMMQPRNFVRGMVLALIATACGGAAAVHSPGSSSGQATVSVRQVMGVGNVYTDAQGRSLYTPAQEATGKIMCTGSCTSIWIPLAAPASGSPTKASAVKGTVSVITRPDGIRQVTLDGAPLYRFFQDAAPGEVNGNGLKDDFGGVNFTWQLEAGTPVQSTPAVPGY